MVRTKNAKHFCVVANLKYRIITTTFAFVISGDMFENKPPLVSRDPDFEGGGIFKIFGRLRRPKILPKYTQIRRVPPSGVPNL